MEQNGPVGMRVPYAQAVYGEEEIQAVNQVLSDPFKISPGVKVKEFETQIATIFGKKHGVMVNSGSAANLLAVEIMRLGAGDEVITPVLTFGTTVAPILQKGATPIFVDVVPGTYQIDPDKIEAAITPNTKAIMIPSLLGNIPDMERLQEIAKKHKLFFVEDSCDTLGATFKGKPTGDYSDISTTSFYASHIITAAASGGMIALHDDALADRTRVLASWGRSSTLFGSHEQSEDIAKRFSGSVGDIPYDAKFVFSEIGYNMQSTELNAAFGLEQLKKLETFAARRKEHHARLLAFFATYEEYFTLPVQHPDVETNWLAFPLTIKPGTPFTRLEITKYLEENNIQTRPIFTGNILRQPAYSYLAEVQKTKEFPVADDIMANGFVVGCHHGLVPEQLDYLEERITSFIASKKG
ncbi:MAG: NarL family transcriptional regulator [Parcubacteria group bacterium]|nr:NarL family transcriptional regulator [Parcubacteria group bacterium]